MRLAFWAVLGAAVALVLGAAGWGMVHAASPATQAVGRPAPALVVRAFDGSTVSLEELRGRPVVVNFWASWCGPCRAEDPALQASARAHQGAVTFLGVAVKDSSAAARAYEEQARHPYPVGEAVAGSPSAFGVTGPPETVFIDSAGVLVARFTGPVDEAVLDRYLQLVGVS